MNPFPRHSLKHRLFTAFNVVMIVYTLCQLFRVVRWSLCYFGKDPMDWCFSEMLINYQGGFVRRGLVGEGLYLLQTTLGVPVVVSAYILCVSVFVWAVWYVVTRFRRWGVAWWLIPTTWLLGAAPYNIIRKDYLVLALTALALWCYCRAKWPYATRLIAATILLTLNVFIYEPVYFLTLPIVAMLLMSESDRGPWRLLPLLTMTAAMGLTTIWSGDAATAEAIHRSWLPMEGMSDVDMPQSFWALTWTPYDSLAYNDSILYTDWSQPSHWLMVVVRLLMLGVFAYFIVRYPYTARVNDRRMMPCGRPVLTLLTLTTMIGLTPMWLGLSCDYGRLMSQTTMLCIIALSAIPPERLAAMYPVGLQTLTCRINDAIDRVIPNRLTTTCLILLLIGLPFARFHLAWMLYDSVAGHIYHYARTLLGFPPLFQ